MNYNGEYSTSYNNVASKEKVNTFMASVYGWMFIALLVTGLAAYFTLSDPTLYRMAAKNYTVLVLLELGVVFGFSLMLDKISPAIAALLFFIYAILNGIVLGIIVSLFTGASVALAFVTSAGLFGAMTLYGYVTKKSLDGIGSYAMLGLFGLVLASIINWFVKSPTMYWILSYAGVIIFVILTAYDTQKIKQIGMRAGGNDEFSKKYAISGALTLYLDFINLFIFLLRIMGKRK